jgi:hypothetical protein
MLPAGSIVGALYHKLQTQSSASEDGRNYRPKYVDLIEIINKMITVASSRLFILLYEPENKAVGYTRVIMAN